MAAGRIFGKGRGEQVCSWLRVLLLQGQDHWAGGEPIANRRELQQGQIPRLARLQQRGLSEPQKGRSPTAARPPSGCSTTRC